MDEVHEAAEMTAFPGPAGRAPVARSLALARSPEPPAMTALLPLMVLLPLLAAALSILVGRSRPAQRVLGLTTLAAMIGIAIAILVQVDRHGTVAVQAGDWPAPIGITLVADRLSAIMLVTASIVLLAVLVYAIGQPGAERNHVGFQSVYIVLAAGVAAAFLTGDLFNLFVSIEMMLTASYVLMTLGGQLDQVRSGMTYVVISLVASVLFLLALAFTTPPPAPSTWPTSPGASPSCPTACGRRWPRCCSSCSASRRRCSRCTSGCPTATRRRPPR